MKGKTVKADDKPEMALFRTEEYFSYMTASSIKENWESWGKTDDHPLVADKLSCKELTHMMYIYQMYTT